MGLVAGILLLLFVLQVLVHRYTMLHLAIIDGSQKADEKNYRFILHPSLILGTEDKESICGHMQHNGLEVLDLIPAELSPDRIMEVFGAAMQNHRPQDLFAPGSSLGAGLVVSVRVAEAAALGSHPANDFVSLSSHASRLKNYAVRSASSAILRNLKEAPRTLEEYFLALRSHAPFVLEFLVTIKAITLVGLAWSLYTSFWWGMIALVFYHLQPLFTRLGSPIKSPRLGRYLLIRSIADAFNLARLLGIWQKAPVRGVADESSLAYYTKNLLLGVSRFFEERTSHCPVCHSENLTRFITTRDYVQRKPGSFRLDECSQCHHIFQNPRLSPLGLDFYYKDFYDGLNAGLVDSAFKAAYFDYFDRARLLPSGLIPRNWLDVGVGHGHFCCVAKEVFPDCSFHGLDMNSHVPVIESYGWIDQGYQGQFPQLAPMLNGQFEVVSMFHYLEHTIDFRAEIAAAHIALVPSGHLVIEVPNPASRIARLAGGLSMVWMQPQHLHMLNRQNIERLLVEAGFSIEPTPPCGYRPKFSLFDIFYSSLNGLAPAPNVPWIRGSRVKSLWRKVAIVISMPWFMLAIVWAFIQPLLMTGEKWDPIVRVVGRKEA